MSTAVSTVNSQITDAILPTNWVAPRKPPYRDSILNDEDIRKVIFTHSKQPTLGRVEAEKLKNSFKKQLCIEMLCQGFHKSFREIDLILKLQIDDRHRLGSEHPVWDRPLLDNENTKLEYLGQKLNKAEMAERLDDHQTVYKTYNDIASYFLIHDDSWLSDYFYGKCLKITQAKGPHAETDKIKLAEAFCNMGLAYERQNAFFESMNNFQQYYELTKGTDWTKKSDYEDLNNNDVQTLEKIKKANVEDYLKKIDDQRMFIDACVHLQRIQRIIANRFAKDPEEKILYLSKAYEVCKSSHIGALEGQASLLLGNAYSENSRLEVGLTYYNNYYEISRRDKDVENFGKASEALAKCYEKMGKVNKSIEYLEKYLKEVSNKEVDYQYSRACSCLAGIYNSMGKYETASEYSQKAFEVSRRMNNSEAIEYNRILFGISKAHNNLKNFNKNIEIANRTTVNNLMTWKYDTRKDKIKILDYKEEGQ